MYSSISSSPRYNRFCKLPFSRMKKKMWYFGFIVESKKSEAGLRLFLDLQENFWRYFILNRKCLFGIIREWTCKMLIHQIFTYGFWKAWMLKIITNPANCHHFTKILTLHTTEYRKKIAESASSENLIPNIVKVFHCPLIWLFEGLLYFFFESI